MNLLGTLAAGGAALVATAVLILGVRGKGDWKFNRHQAAIGGLIAGTLFGATAKLHDVQPTVAANLQHTLSRGPFGNVGMGAVALLLTVLVYGAALKPRTSAIVGIAAAGVYAAAGGIWGMGASTLAAFLQQVAG